jgi:hypothetical protein
MMILAYRTLRQSYNGFSDLLRVGLSDIPADIGEDTPSGFIVHYALPSREPVGVEVMRYCLRFGGEQKTLHIDAEPPFEIEVGKVDCDQELGGDLADFDQALRALLGS